MAAGNFICDKVQRALALLIQQANPTLVPNEQIYKGIRNVTAASDESEESVRNLPCVNCICQGADVLDGDIDGINWVAHARVEIRSAADDTTEDQHHNRSMEIIDIIATDEIAVNLSNMLADFTAFLFIPRAQTSEAQSRMWVTVFEFDVHCAGSDIE